MKAIFFVFGIFLVCFSCDKTEILTLSEEKNEGLPHLIQNPSSNNHVRLINSNVSLRNASQSNIIVEDGYDWEHIASVEALIYENTLLSATSIVLSNDFALVSYHKRGNIHKGAVEIIDIKNPNKPLSLGFIPFPNTDINALAVDPFEQNVLWVAGSSSKIGAALYKINHDGSFNISTFQRINLSKGLGGGISASANGIYLSQDYIFVSSGKTVGGVAKLDRSSLEIIHTDEFSGAKGITGNSVNGIEYYASLMVSAQNEVAIKRVDNDDFVLNIQVNSSSHQSVDLPHDGKYDLQFSPLNPAELYVSSAQNGAYSVNITTGETVKTTDHKMLPKGNTNAVHVDNEFIYMANGEDGLSIALLNTAEATGLVEPIYHWDLPEKPASVNFVTAKDSFVYVAKGLGGFHILKYQCKKIYKTVTPFNLNGTPTIMKTIDCCPDLISNVITLALPQGENVFDHSPEYFDNPNSSFLLEEDAQVEVTFLYDGASFRNILGYYAYPVDQPPNSIEDLNKLVIFPNASALNSGGELIMGNTVEILGTFPKGTVFGFFLVSNGWSWKKEMTEGYYTQYSDWQFNENGKQQNLIFYDQDCDAFVLCFEDILLPGGDKDFNDVIFQVTSTPDNAFRKTAYLQIR